jgi:hypothetical protein
MNSMALRLVTASPELVRVNGKPHAESVFDDIEAMLERKSERDDKSEKSEKVCELVHSRSSQNVLMRQSLRQ